MKLLTMIVPPAPHRAAIWPGPFDGDLTSSDARRKKGPLRMVDLTPALTSCASAYRGELELSPSGYSAQ